jgi:hypothetical protein
MSYSEGGGTREGVEEVGEKRVASFSSSGGMIMAEKFDED